MDVIKNNFFVTMIRKNIDNIPIYELPGLYSIKWYQPGDEKQWFEIQKISDKYSSISLETFYQQFGEDLESLSERQCFLLDTNGTSIGTATAWFNNNYNGQIFGRLHWVAVTPRMQGKGLSKPLLSIILNRLRCLKYNKVYLTTSTARIVAINLYLKFGFKPELKNSNDSYIWQEMARILKLQPELWHENESIK